jgi:cysteine desulfurase/selenocysteine lyase
VIEHPAYDLNIVRAMFPITKQITYLNHAAISPIPTPTQVVMAQAADRLAHDPMSFYAPKPGDPLSNPFVEFSTEVAGLINAAELHEIVPVSTTSAALNLIAQAINWQAGDNIVFADIEFPSNAYPWMVLERRGVECRLASPVNGGATLAAFDSLVDDRTRLITVSALQFLTGHRTDLAALGAYCRARGILFAVDAIQSAGHIPLDVQAMQIDILAAGGQKSLMATPGLGFLYVRDAVCDTMQPNIVGPTGVEDWEHWIRYDLTPRKGALRFILGTPNVVGIFALIESVRFLRKLGVENIDAWTQHLSQVAIQDLTGRGYTVITPTDPALHGPIVTFRVGDPHDLDRATDQAAHLLKHLFANNIHVTRHWDAAGAPHLRISTHCYNTEDEVRRVGAVLEEAPL